MVKINPQILSVLEKEGISSFYPPQEKAIDAAIKGENIIVSIPTASGKTLISEVLMLQKLLRSKEKKALYLCPLRALAYEKKKEFTKRWGQLGIKVGMAVGDLDQKAFWVFNNDIIILTNEKTDSLLRMKPELIKDISVVVVDEIHLINDKTRGITLEFLITRLKTINPEIQFVGLSATIQNGFELANWLDAKHITSDWRPVELKEGFYLANSSQIHFNDETTRRIVELQGYEAYISLAVDMIKDGGQVLVFNSSRRNAEAAALKLSRVVRKFLDTNAKTSLGKLVEEFKKKYNDDLKSTRNLLEAIDGGVAFHHAGIDSKKLDFIAEGFNNKHIKVISCTPTLAAGVNTPARRVIIRSLYRYSGEDGMKPIPIIEYKQIAGRAGRPGYDPYGEVVILGKNPQKLAEDAISFIQNDPEAIISKLGDETHLQKHILGLISSCEASTLVEINQFIKNTFYYEQKINSKSALHTVTNIKEKKVYKKKIKAPMAHARYNVGKPIDPLGLSSTASFGDTTFGSAFDLLEEKKSQNLISGLPIKEFDAETTISIDNEISTKIEQTIDYFLEYNLIMGEDGVERVITTKIGKIVSQLYLSPADWIEIMQSLKNMGKNGGGPQNILTWLFELTKLDSIYKPYVRQNDYILIEQFFVRNREFFYFDGENRNFSDILYQEFGTQLKLTMILYFWTDETSIQEIAENFNIGAGDLHRYIETSVWLGRAFHQIYYAIEGLNFEYDFTGFNTQIRYGVRASLLPFISLRGIGRIRARKLYQAGFRTLMDLKTSSTDKISAVPLIGNKIAQNIKDQLLDTKKYIKTNFTVEKPIMKKRGLDAFF